MLTLATTRMLQPATTRMLQSATTKTRVSGLFSSVITSSQRALVYRAVGNLEKPGERQECAGPGDLLVGAYAMPGRSLFTHDSRPGETPLEQGDAIIASRERETGAARRVMVPRVARGRWRSARSFVAEHCRSPAMTAALSSRALRPTPALRAIGEEWASLEHHICLHHSIP